jgi:hypothetical protein
MAWTATTSSLKKSTLDFIGNVGRTGATKFVFYVQYTKGDETAATLGISFINDRISASTQFVSSPVDTATVAKQTFTITGTKNTVVQVTVPKCVSSVVAALGSTGSTATGTIVIDGYPDVSQS